MIVKPGSAASAQELSRALSQHASEVGIPTLSDPPVNDPPVILVSAPMVQVSDNALPQPVAQSVIVQPQNAEVLHH